MIEVVEYETRITQLTVLPVGEKLFSDTATVVSIVDDAAGEYITVHQDFDDMTQGEVKIDPAEWSKIREAIDELNGRIK